MRTKIIQGIIRFSGEYDEIYIGDTYVVDFISEISEGSKVGLAYYISNTELPAERIEEIYLQRYYDGIVQSNNDYISGTEWTGTYARNDDLFVGGHDITAELSDNIGKYCILKIYLNEN